MHEKEKPCFDQKRGFFIWLLRGYIIGTKVPKMRAGHQLSGDLRNKL
jgi:hypothetical protein